MPLFEASVLRNNLVTFDPVCVSVSAAEMDNKILSICTRYANLVKCIHIHSLVQSLIFTREFFKKKAVLLH